MDDLRPAGAAGLFPSPLQAPLVLGWPGRVAHGKESSYRHFTWNHALVFEAIHPRTTELSRPWLPSPATAYSQLILHAACGLVNLGASHVQPMGLAWLVLKNRSNLDALPLQLTCSLSLRRQASCIEPTRQRSVLHRRAVLLKCL